MVASTPGRRLFLVTELGAGLASWLTFSDILPLKSELCCRWLSVVDRFCSPAAKPYSCGTSISADDLKCNLPWQFEPYQVKIFYWEYEWDITFLYTAGILKAVFKLATSRRFYSRHILDSDGELSTVGKFFGTLDSEHVGLHCIIVV